MSVSQCEFVTPANCGTISNRSNGFSFQRRPDRKSRSDNSPTFATREVRRSSKSEDTFLLGYVLFDKKADEAEVDVVEDAQAFLQSKIDSGEFTLPAGVTYTFAGNYENQIRSQKTLAIVLPLATRDHLLDSVPAIQNQPSQHR